MERRTRWIVLGLLVAIAGVLAVGWRVTGRGSRGCRGKKPSAAAPREPVVGPRELARRQSALRRRLRRLGWSAKAPRLLVGRVTSTQGSPVASATIRVLLPKGRVLLARAGADGRYRLAQVPATATRMEASARGYETRVYEPFTLPAAPQVRWDVTLKAARGVHGVVLADGKPVVGAVVRLWRRGGRKHPHTRTGLGGRFALPFEGRVGVKHLLMAWHAQHGVARKTVTGPGEVTLNLPGGGYVEGRVQDDQGQPVKQFVLSATSLARDRGGQPVRAFDTADGTFRLGPLAPGRQQIYVIASGYEPTESKRFRIRSGQTIRNVVITLGTSGELIGSVTDASTGQPIRGALVAPAEWGSGALGEAAGATTDTNGHYTLRSVRGRRTSLRVKAEGYEPLLAGGVTCGAGKQCRRDFALTPAPQGRRPGGQLTGVGAVLRKTSRGVLIQQLIDGGPASDVLRRGDLVVMVGELDATRVSLREVVNAIRGDVGTDVVLWIRRGGSAEPRRVVITRERVTLPSRKRR